MSEACKTGEAVWKWLLLSGWVRKYGVKKQDWEATTELSGTGTVRGLWCLSAAG